MRQFLTLVWILALLASLGTCAVSKGAVHEIEAIVLLLIAVVAMSASAILRALEEARKPPPPAKP